MIKDAPLSGYTKEAYRDYAMYVLLDRALPRLADGFKPVQRRIVFAMHELGLSATSKPKKSARTIGDVLGKYHPHSDQACYEALVGLAQGFSTRYPVIEGQGNFGSLDDPKSFAAMRYTEVRLSSYAKLLLDELSPASVPWQLNFDGTCSEPIILPAKVPFLLLNGCSGIAVGMSTEIPPHNLNELINAIILMLDNPKASLEELLELMPGPDFPTGGIIRATIEDLKEFYEKGKGSFLLQAVIIQEEKTLVIKEIPYYTTVSRLIEQLQQVNAVKPITAPFELIDESDEHNPVRIVLHFKSAALASVAIEQLFEKTELQRVYRCYFNGLDTENVPTCFSLHRYLTEWIAFRIQCLKQQFIARLDFIEKRIKIIHACMIVFQHMKQILELIQSEEDPWIVIAQRFNLDNDQIEALAGLRLRQLTKLSFVELKKELDTLLIEQKELEGLLASPTKLKNYIKNQLKEISKAFSDKRRTQLLNPELKKNLPNLELKKDDVKPLTLILSQLGWIKTIKGHQVGEEHTTFRQGDSFRSRQECLSDQDCVFVDNQGRLYGMNVNLLPSSRYGEHVSTLLSLPSGHQVIACLSLALPVFMMTNQGFGFIVEQEGLSVNKRGKNVFKLADQEYVAWAFNIVGDFLLIVDEEKKIGVLNVKDLPVRRSGHGLQLVRSASIVSVQSLSHQSILEARFSHGKALIIDKKEFIIGRGQSLKKMPKKFTGFTEITVL
jgi:topoisomerase-4 subunit A